jgi:ribosome-binding protein aMBF1 (putative translation factor)
MRATVRRTARVRMLTPAQIRAARALLDWSQPELADRAGVHVNSIKSFERRRSAPIWTTMAKIERALKKAGIEFIDADDSRGSGVRFKDPGR